MSYVANINDRYENVKFKEHLNLFRMQGLQLLRHTSSQKDQEGRTVHHDNVRQNHQDNMYT